MGPNKPQLDYPGHRGRGSRVVHETRARHASHPCRRAQRRPVHAGFIDQSLINIQTGDFGGELDPHGADLRGNPLGGLVYSTAWSGKNDTFTQVIEWHNFMGGDAFCFKVCDPSRPNAANFCQPR
ncbi:hypothetical protein PTI98_009079 [Pleurotus ostreatus]|nr:hypothetical protein PTI98_009079 [Pleurotus ostreatus]